jgi:hypothetical protein
MSPSSFSIRFLFSSRLVFCFSLSICLFRASCASLCTRCPVLRGSASDDEGRIGLFMVGVWNLLVCQDFPRCLRL